MELVQTSSHPGEEMKRLSFFERYLTLWVALCLYGHRGTHRAGGA